MQAEDVMHCVCDYFCMLMLDIVMLLRKQFILF